MRLSCERADWALGFVDEVWWSRFAQPRMHGWSAPEKPLRLVSRSKQKEDPQPKALSSYGVVLEGTEERQMLIRFAADRLVSSVTTQFLEWVLEELTGKGKRVWVLVWDNASWHISAEVKTWIKGHNARARQEGGVRLLSCELPVKSPWLNPIEPMWLHGKRAICEPDGELTARDVMERVCAHYGCELLEPLAKKTP